MKKIDGTLYSPVVNGEREKMYVETIPEAVSMGDGSTLQDRLDEKSASIVISTTKPNKESLWINPSGIDPSTYFNFKDVNVTPASDSTPIHTLRTPADDNGQRTIVYPLTSADKVHVTDTDSIQDVFNRYDMGFEAGREKPDHKAFWGDEVYQTATINDLGKEEEVILMNDFFATKVKIDGNTMTNQNFVFTFTNQGERLTMVFFDTESKLVHATDTNPNKPGIWVDDLYHIYQQNPIDLENFLLDAVEIDGKEYKNSSLIIDYSGNKWAFINPDKLIISGTKPRVYQDTIWANTSV